MHFIRDSGLTFDLALTYVFSNKYVKLLKNISKIPNGIVLKDKFSEN